MNAKKAGIVYGSSPRADLLPLEIKAAKRGDRRRRSLLFGVIIVALVAAGGYGFAVFEATQSQAALDLAQQRTLTLLDQQTEFLPGRQVKQEISSLESALQVGASTEIDWNTYMALVQQSLPPGAEITVFAVRSSSPVEEPEVATSPLQGPFVATITFTAASQSLPDIESWLRGLESLPGFADANPDSVTRTGAEPYVATITMHITSEAYSGRFQPIVEDATADEADAEDTEN